MMSLSSIEHASLMILFLSALGINSFDQSEEGFLEDHNPCNDYYYSSDSCQCFLNADQSYDLRCHRLVQISSDFNYSEIHFSNSPLVTLSHNVFNNATVVRLLLKNCSLTSQSLFALSHLHNLTFLDISWNQINDISLNNVNLTYLNMGNNPCTRMNLSRLLHSLPNLSELYLNNSNLRTFPKISIVSNLAKLILSYNRIDAIGIQRISELPKLAYIDLSFNNIINAIDPIWMNIPDLKILILKGNKLMSTPDINSDSLIFLDVSDNQIDVPPGYRLYHCTALSQINLSGNKLVSLNSTSFYGLLARNFKLQLNLSRNPITNIDRCTFPMSMRHNRITLGSNSCILKCTCSIASLIYSSIVDDDIYCNHMGECQKVIPGNERWAKTVCPDVDHMICNDTDINSIKSYALHDISVPQIILYFMIACFIR